MKCAETDFIEEGYFYTSEFYEVPLSEMLEFNSKWDPLPIHTDQRAAKLTGYRDVIASGQYVMCVKQHFISSIPWRKNIVASAGFDELRFHKPVYANDRLHLSLECTHRRASVKNPSKIVCKFQVQIYNQSDNVVLSYIDTIILQTSSGILQTSSGSVVLDTKLAKTEN